MIIAPEAWVDIMNGSDVKRATSLSGLTKYYAVFVPAITLLVEGVAYIKKEVVYYYLGIGISPHLNQINIVLSGFLLGILLCFVALPTVYHLNDKNKKNDGWFYFILFLVSLCMSFLSDTGPIIYKIIYALFWFVPLMFIPLLIAEIVFKKDKLNSLTQSHFGIIQVFKTVGLVIISLFSLTVITIKQPLFSITQPAEHNLIRYQNNNYVIISEDNDIYLLSKLCKNYTVDRGAFRFVNAESVGDTTIRTFALSPAACKH